jgi:methylated-DNA-protein-cysteine methyltransferase-like protein
MSPGRRTAEFEQAVVDVLASLQPGEVVTYGEVAELAGYPGRARAVGRLLAQTVKEVPWWRVVGHGGRLISPQSEEQARLLRKEGYPIA